MSGLLVLAVALGFVIGREASAQPAEDSLAVEQAGNQKRIKEIDLEAGALVKSLQQKGREIENHKLHKPNPRDHDAVKTYNDKSDRLDAEHDALVKQIDALKAEQDSLIARNRQIAAWLKLPFKVAPGWRQAPDELLQLQKLAALISAIPDKVGESVVGNEMATGEAFKEWVAKNVVVEPAAAQVLGVSAKPGKLEFSPILFEQSGPDKQCKPNNQCGLDRQKSLVALELGKVLWFAINNNESKVAQTDAAREFQALCEQRHLVSLSLSELKTAPLGQAHLGDLGDLDLQSQFGYAVRVALFQLQPNIDASNEVKKDWIAARTDMQLYLIGLLRERR